MATRNWAPVSASTDMNAVANYDGSGSLTGEDLVFNASANNVIATASLSVASVTIGVSCTGNFTVNTAFTLTISGNFDCTNYTKTVGGTGALSIGGNFTLGTGITAFSVSGITTFTGTPTVNMGGKSHTVGRMVFNGNATINAATTSTINRITLHAGSTYTITAGTTLTITTFTAGDWSGTAGNLVTLVSSSGGTTAALKFTAQPTCSYISVTDIDSTASATVPLAFDGTSVHGSNVSGWRFDSVYYCDVAAAGTNDGSSQTNAWTNITSYTNVARCCNDTCYCKVGTQIIASAGTLLNLFNSGSAIGGYINVIGCDTNWVPKAGQFTIQGKAGDLPVDLLNIGAIKYWNFENITFDAATTQLVHSTANYMQFHRFYKCRFINSSGIGISLGTTAYDNIYDNCDFQNNTGIAMSTVVLSIVQNCKFIGNGAGITSASATCNPIVKNCIFHANSDDDISSTGASPIIILGNIFNGNIGGSCLKLADASVASWIYFNKFTSANQYGIEVVAASDCSNVEDYNYFFGNGQGARLNCDTGANSVNGADAGVVSVALDDFRTNLATLLRRIPLNLDWDLATASQRNICYPTAGLPPDDEVKHLFNKLFNE